MPTIVGYHISGRVSRAEIEDSGDGSPKAVSDRQLGLGSWQGAVGSRQDPESGKQMLLILAPDF